MAQAEVACWRVGQEVELYTDPAHHHHLVRMEPEYQIVAGMGMGL